MEEREEQQLDDDGTQVQLLLGQYQPLQSLELQWTLRSTDYHDYNYFDDFDNIIDKILLKRFELNCMRAISFLSKKAIPDVI